MQRRGLAKFDVQSDLRVHVIPGFQDNYFYIVEQPSTSRCVAIDPGAVQPIRSYLCQWKLTLTAIFLTHHHRDHTGGVQELIEEFPDVTITCSEWMNRPDAWSRAKMNSIRTSDPNPITILDKSVTTLDVRGHTLDHIAFVFSDRKMTNLPPDVFVGDSLFGAGCGGLFEGSYEQMLCSLQRIRSLPSESRIWCAHEYTLKNLRIAVRLRENNQKQKMRLARLEKESAGSAAEPHEWMTVPLILDEEIQTNPFLRWDQPSLQKAIDTTGSLETFTYVRRFRDQF